MARIPYFDFSKASPELADAMKDRRPLNIYRMIAHGGPAAIAFLAFGRAILTTTEIDATLRELVILRVAAHGGSTYEVTQHRRLAAKAGIPAQKIEAAVADPAAELPAGPFDDLEQAVLRFTDSVVRDVKAPDPRFDALAARLSHRQIVELLMTIGFYMLAGRISENLEVDPEELASP